MNNRRQGALTDMDFNAMSHTGKQQLQCSPRNKGLLEVVCGAWLSVLQYSLKHTNTLLRGERMAHCGFDMRAGVRTVLGVIAKDSQPTAQGRALGLRKRFYFS